MCSSNNSNSSSNSGFTASAMLMNNYEAQFYHILGPVDHKTSCLSGFIFPVERMFHNILVAVARACVRTRNTTHITCCDTSLMCVNFAKSLFEVTAILNTPRNGPGFGRYR